MEYVSNDVNTKLEKEKLMFNSDKYSIVFDDVTKVCLTIVLYLST